jgi:hypothetical protein
LELAGYENMLSKIIGSNNKLNNALTTLKALASYKYAEFFNKVMAEVNAKDADDEDDALTEGEVKVEKGKVISKIEDGKKETLKDEGTSPAVKPVAKKPITKK